VPTANRHDDSTCGLSATNRRVRRPRVRVQVLNGFQIFIDDEPVDLPSPAQRVVAFTALHRRALRREFVAETLWADRDRNRASANLRSALWQLRAAPEIVTVTRTHIALSAHVQTDLSELRSLTTGIFADEQPAVDRPHDITTQQVEFLDRDLLPEWYDDWAEFERERLRQLRIGALEELSNRLRRQRRFVLAIISALAAIRIEPFRETAHRALIEAHLDAGNRCEARRHYAHLCKLLDRELGLPPDPELTSLIVKSCGS
jgi:DNA-binding SARP family transcriptional activator